MEPLELIKEANSRKGCLSHQKTTKGRRQFPDEEDLLEMESAFASDSARILSSKAYHLLEKKTQVITHPTNPFIRNRARHVHEVVAISIVTADVLGLNRDLAQSIAHGHDIGHVPFGHPGEHLLARIMGRREFCHEILGPLVAQKIERRGRGLNLTFETLEGMMCHSGNTARENMTPEAWVVRYTDKFAYIFADYNDIKERMAYPVSKQVCELMNEFGQTQRQRTTVAMSGLILESAEVGRVSFEHSDLAVKFKELRRLMMSTYVHITQQNLENIIVPVLEFLRELDIGDPFLLYSLLTDRDVEKLAAIQARNITHLRDTALSERLEYLPELGDIDICCPYLDW